MALTLVGARCKIVASLKAQWNLGNRKLKRHEISDIAMVCAWQAGCCLAANAANTNSHIAKA